MGLRSPDGMPANLLNNSSNLENHIVTAPLSDDACANRPPTLTVTGRHAHSRQTSKRCGDREHVLHVRIERVRGRSELGGGVDGGEVEEDVDGGGGGGSDGAAVVVVNKVEFKERMIRVKIINRAVTRTRASAVYTSNF